MNDIDILELTGLVKETNLMVAGQVGSGKTVLIKTVIKELMDKESPEELQFLLIGKELMLFDGDPHLIRSVIIDHSDASKALVSMTEIMDERLVKPANQNTMPQIVIVIDDLRRMLTKNARGSFERLISHGDEVGIHIIFTTQSVEKAVSGDLRSKVMTLLMGVGFTNNVDTRKRKGFQDGDELFYDDERIIVTAGGYMGCVDAIALNGMTYSSIYVSEWMKTGRNFGIIKELLKEIRELE